MLSLEEMRSLTPEELNFRGELLKISWVNLFEESCPCCGTPLPAYDPNQGRFVVDKAGYVQILGNRPPVCLNLDCPSRQIALIDGKIVWTRIKAHPNLAKRLNRFSPAEKECTWCHTSLLVLKTVLEREVRTLKQIVKLDEVQFYCPNPACPGRHKDGKSDKMIPQVYKSQTLRRVVLPKMTYGLDVILELGRRAKGDPKPLKDILKVFNEEFGLKISLSTAYRYRDLYTALCAGVMVDHAPDIAKALQEQYASIWVVDATELKGSAKLYRVIDYISGTCLGTLLISEGEKTTVQPWLNQVYQFFGRPDYLVSDGEDALHSDTEDPLAIRHQDCWEHALSNILDALLETWRSQAKNFLTGTKYQTRLRAILAKVEGSKCSTWSKPQKLLRDIIQIFLADPAGVSKFADRMAQRLRQFHGARTVVNMWIRALRGNKMSGMANNSPLESYHRSKSQLSKQEQTKFITDRAFVKEPVYEALMEFKTLIDQICKDKKLKKLLTAYNNLYDEFCLLRSWLNEALIRRNEASGWLDREVQTKSDQRLKTLIQSATQHAQKIQRTKLAEFQTWDWRGAEPDLPLIEKAQWLLRRIMTRWEAKTEHSKEFEKAVAILERQFDRLLIFFQNVAIPISNQSIETNNGSLKQIWRRSSGCNDRAYTLEYHGHSDSMALNFYQGESKEAPLEILGFSRAQLAEWLETCSKEKLTEARAAMEEVRRIRRQRLQATRQSIPEVFKDTEQAWSNCGFQILNEYLANKGR